MERARGTKHLNQEELYKRFLCFTNIENVIKFVSFGCSNIRELLEKRLVNRAFREVIDEYILHHWIKVVRKGDIKIYLRSPSVYVVSQIFRARDWEAKQVTRVVSDIGAFNFQLEWLDNTFKECIDDLFIQRYGLNVLLPYRDGTYTTVLIQMLMGRKYISLHFLLSRGVDVNLGNPLLQFVRREHTNEVVKWLILHGADVNKGSPLLVSNSTHIMTLLNAPTINVNQVEIPTGLGTPTGDTLLKRIVKRSFSYPNRDFVARRLLEMGATHDGLLKIAIGENDFRIASLLIEYNTDLTGALNVALDNENSTYGFIKSLVDKGATLTSRPSNMGDGDTRIVKMFR